MLINVHRVLVKLTTHDWPPIMISSSDYFNNLSFYIISFFIFMGENWEIY
jgi:hypothetical protein